MALNRQRSGETKQCNVPKGWNINQDVLTHRERAITRDSKRKPLVELLDLYNQEIKSRGRDY